MRPVSRVDAMQLGIRVHESPGLAYVRLMEEHVNEETGKSNLRRQQALHSSAVAAVQYGLHFERDDFKTILKWTQAAEELYAKAARYRAPNVSACRSLEHALDRKPFLDNEKHRIAVGSNVTWLGDSQSRVMSFFNRPDGGEDGFRVCQYHRGEGPTCVKHSYEITRSQWVARAPAWGGDVGARYTWRGEDIRVFDYAVNLKWLRASLEEHGDVRSVQSPHLFRITLEEWERARMPQVAANVEHALLSRGAEYV